MLQRVRCFGRHLLDALLAKRDLPPSLVTTSIRVERHEASPRRRVLRPDPEPIPAAGFSPASAD